MYAGTAIRAYENIENTQDVSSPQDRLSFLSKSCRVCKLFGIEIHIHILLPLYLVLRILLWAPAISATHDPHIIGWYFLLILVSYASLWESVFVHELGHALAGYLVGGHTDRILLWPLGGLAFTQPPATMNNAAGDSKRRKNQILISLGGPLTHIPHMILYAALLLWYCGGSWSLAPTFLVTARGEFAWGAWLWYYFLQDSFMIHVWLFSVNLLVPAYPLDGSKVFANCLLSKYSVDTAAKIYCWVTGAIAALCIILGSVFLISSVLVFVGVWAAYQVYYVVMLLRAGNARTHPLFA